MPETTAQPDSQALGMWVIYDHPTDYPGAWLARRWLILDGRAIATEQCLVSQSIDRIREWMRDRGFTCIVRDPSDVPAIVETWL